MSRPLARIIAALVAGCAGTASAQILSKPDGVWRASVAATATGASGNTENASLGIKAEAVRQTDSDRLGLQLQQVLSASNDVESGERSPTGRILRVGGRYSRDIVDRWFAFGALDYEHDRLAGIRQRLLPQAGGGFHAIATDTTTFDVFGGLAINRTTYYEQPGVRDAELLLGEESTHRIGPDTVVRQRLAVYAPFDDPSGAFRLQFDAGVVTRITGGLGLTVNLTERYSARPALGKRRNDLQVFVGLQYGWNTP